MCFIQSVEGRPDEHLRSREGRGAALQVRIGHLGSNFNVHSRAAREAFGWGYLVRADVVPRSVRPGRWRHQERRDSRGVRPRWSASTWTIRTSRRSSTGRCAREKKAHALIAAGYSSDFNGDAYHTISGQNSNNSVRVTDEFMRAALAGSKWQTRYRTTGELCDTYEAKELWRQVAEAAWGCGRPGRAVRFHDQPLAHVSEHRAHQRVESVLGIPLPRRHRLQPREREPDQVPARRD